MTGRPGDMMGLAFAKMRVEKYTSVGRLIIRKVRM